MGISHLLLNSLTLYNLTTSTDDWGGDNILLSNIGTYRCKVSAVNQKRELILGKDNTVATHKIYCDTVIGTSLSLGQIIVVNNRQYEIIDFFAPEHIISDSSLDHIKIYVRYNENEYDYLLFGSSSSSSEEYSTSSSSSSEGESSNSSTSSQSIIIIESSSLSSESSSSSDEYSNSSLSSESSQSSSSSSSSSSSLSSSSESTQSSQSSQSSESSSSSELYSNSSESSESSSSELYSNSSESSSSENYSLSSQSSSSDNYSLSSVSSESSESTPSSLSSESSKSSSSSSGGYSNSSESSSSSELFSNSSQSSESSSSSELFSNSSESSSSSELNSESSQSDIKSESSLSSESSSSSELYSNSSESSESSSSELFSNSSLSSESSSSEGYSNSSESSSSSENYSESSSSSSYCPVCSTSSSSESSSSSDNYSESSESSSSSSSDNYSESSSSSSSAIGGDSKYYIPITIDSTYIDSTLTNWTFVFDQNLDSVLTSINGPLDQDGIRSLKSDGGDIRFTSDIEGYDRLAVDVRNVDLDNNPASSELEIAVKVPSVSSSEDTVIYMWWGGETDELPAASDTYGQYNAYDSNYILVQPEGNGDNERTNNNYSWTKVDNPVEVDGMIGKATEYSQVNYGNSAATQYYYTTQKPISGYKNYTVEYLANFHRRETMTIYAERKSDAYNLLCYTTVDGLRSAIRDDDGDSIFLGYLNDYRGWGHFSFTFDTPADTMKLYKNGVEDDTDTNTNLDTITQTNLRSSIGAGWTGADYVAGFDGLLDELRISLTVRSAAWIKAVYNNLMNAVNFADLGEIIDVHYSSSSSSSVDSSSSSSVDSSSSSSSAVGGDSKYYIPITIDSTKIDSDLENWTFVFDENFASILTSINGPLDSDGVRSMKQHGGDIRFTSDEAGYDRLAIDVRCCSPDKIPSNGCLEVAVKIPAVSSSSDTVIYMWWGGENYELEPVDSTYGQHNAYDDNYVLILPNGASSDRSQNQYSTTDNSITSGGDTGKVGKATNYAGNASTDRCTIGDTSDWNTILSYDHAFTIEGIWELEDNTINSPCILISKIQSAPDYKGVSMAYTPSNTDLTGIIQETHSPSIRFGIQNASFAWANNEWKHMALAYNGTSIASGGVSLYSNGATTGSGVDDGTVTTTSHADPLLIGSRNWGAPFTMREWEGDIDEIRISDVERSAAWIKANYNNLLNTSGFLTFGGINDLTEESSSSSS